MPNFANFLQDGASTTLPASYNNDNAVFETLSEVQVNTSSFSAQYGQGGVVFNQITKGGTNSWHGSAYEYFQNDALNAAGYFKPVPFLEHSAEDYDQQMALNRSFFFLTQAVAGNMKAHGRGAIVNIGSSGRIRPSRLRPHLPILCKRQGCIRLRSTRPWNSRISE